MFRNKCLVGVVGLAALLCGIFPKGTAQSMAMENPKVTISFPDVGDYDFLNETVAVMSNSNAAFEMMCNATYPIEWIFHYSREDDGTSEKVKLADTYRTVEDFNDPLTYAYSAKLRLEYNGKLLVLSNFTCKATETDHEFYHTHVYMKEAEEKSILILEVSSGRYIGEEEVRASQVTPNRSNCEKAVARVEYPRWTRNPCWSCLKPQEPENELELDFQWCKTPIQCNSMHKRQRKGKECLDLKFLDVEESECHKFDNPASFFPRLVLCKNYGPALAQFYFFGVMRGEWANRDIDGPPIYFSWEDANATDMLYMHPIQKKVYLGESIDFKCDYSRYYFSLGSWLGVRSPSGMEYTRGFDIKFCETNSEVINSNKFHNCNKSEDFKRLGIYSATTNVTFKEVGEHEVFCFGPVWNTTQWVNVSMTFAVEMGEKPSVISVIPDEAGEEFIIGQENRTLICSFTGKPLPKVTWDGPNDTFWEPITTSSESILRLREIGYKSSGVYTCTVSSFLGKNSQTFKISSHLPSWELSGGAIAGIVVGCVILFVIVLAVIGRLSMIIVKQRQALRLLTESEVEGFFKGDPDLAKGKGDFLDSQFAIDALAYDKRYEIPTGNLAVDYATVLGSGEFGIVVKGKINPRAVSIYLNFSDDGKPLDDEELSVAVKTCKKDVDVSSFKGILSEVKVMAYLGKHENIVSLIGASTQNIRNRELLIAVEYCLNGSMDGFLKKNKERFVSQVKYGYYREEAWETEGEKQNPDGAYINLKEANSIRLKRKDSGWEFSTLDLFLWTHDIAEGVGYIHNKKVIHGDLAIRNVLLTRDFVAKVGDFGLSRQLEGMSSYTKKTQCPLPWRNMAIESLMEMCFSPNSDMWSLGVTIWELFTLGDVPYPGMAFSMDFLRDLENGSVRLFKPPNATNDLYELLLRCWKRRPDERPSTTDIKLLCENLFKKAGYKHDG